VKYMAISLKKFKASELAAAVGRTLGRGRPTFEARDNLELEVLKEISAKRVGVRKGKLVRL
jgi:hypothetical protein